MVTKDERPSASRVVEGDGRQRCLVQFGLDWTGLDWTARPPGCCAALRFATCLLACLPHALVLPLLPLLLLHLGGPRQAGGWSSEV